MTAKYEIETREAGWPRYRVTRTDPNGGRYLVGEFWTLWGARRWITTRQWKVIDK